MTTEALGAASPGAVLTEKLLERMLETAHALRAAYRIGVDLSVAERTEILRQIATLEAQGQVLMANLHHAMAGLRAGGPSADRILAESGRAAHKATLEWLKGVRESP